MPVCTGGQSTIRHFHRDSCKFYTLFSYIRLHIAIHVLVSDIVSFYRRERVRVETTVHACMHSLTGYIWHAFYFHPHISNDSYLLNQMFVTETSYIFEFVGEDLQNMISFEYIWAIFSYIFQLHLKLVS